MRDLPIIALDFDSEDPFRCGVILGSGVGGLNEIETQVGRLLTKGPDKVSAFTIPKLMVSETSVAATSAVQTAIEIL